MKFSAVLILSVATAVVAQTAADIPLCATSCLGALSSTGCKDADFECVCSNKDFITNISGCVAESCEKDDQDKTITFATTLCKGVGVTIPEELIESVRAAAATKSGAPSMPSDAPSTTDDDSTSASATASGDVSTSTPGAANKLSVSGLSLGAAAAALFLL